MCLILDEVHGSDPHAQKKLTEWMASNDRHVPVIMTCNEVPRIMKSNPQIHLLRCFPPKPTEMLQLFQTYDVQQVTELAKRFKHDVRRILQYLQYGQSVSLPASTRPMDCSPEVAYLLGQKMWVQDDPLIGCHGDTSGKTHSA